MEKLSTAKLKELISTWLGDPKIRKDLQHHSQPYRGDETVITQKWIDERAEWYGAKKGLSLAQLEQHVWDIWRDGAQWKRHEKRKLKECWEDYLTATDWDKKPTDWKPGDPLPTYPCFPEDIYSGVDEALLKRYHDDPKEGQKCILRVFQAPHGLCDNYRLEVVTTPDDTQVVGWTVIVD